MAVFDLHLKDEIPRVGSGLRRVVVKSCGPKWVKLVNPANGAFNGVVVRRKVWDVVKKVQVA